MAQPLPDSTAMTSTAKANLRKVCSNTSHVPISPTYKQFFIAEKAYKEAAQLDPEDAAPWSNISAINFERGHYYAALESVNWALSLLSLEPVDIPKKQKLQLRAAKCHLYLLSLADAERAAKLLSDDAEGQSLISSIKRLRCFGLRCQTRLPRAANCWIDYRDTSPICKEAPLTPPSWMQLIILLSLNAPEYYAIGHDNAVSLVDKELQSTVPADCNVAFMLCGSGDARHVLVTLFSLFGWGGTLDHTGNQGFGKAHFTLADINAAAFARLLVLFDMMFLYSIMKTEKMPRIEDALTNMAYTYSAFVPPFVVFKMMEHVRTLIDDLEGEADSPGSEILKILYLSKETRVQVLRKLKQWTESLDEQFPFKRLRAASMEQRRFGPPDNRQNPHTKQCHNDLKDFGVIFADTELLKRREPEIIPLLDAFRSGRPSAKKALEEHIDTNWKMNPTVLDVDFEKQKNKEELYFEGPALEWNPVDLVTSLGSPENESIINSLSTWFDGLTMSSLLLHDRVQIEIIVGEMADVMERIQHNCLEHRLVKSHNPEAMDATQFPLAYDRIHMSNVPDYVGGPLTAHLCGEPLLRTDRRSSLTYNNLLNPPMF